ncbi:hypothetical protein [Arsenicicoccus dermatophilus]|uniref:hypothetical protein n=1 Tax=Arsenicicoccus dermatophilus TaxID=1076331 RepID=UPI001F4CB046|nr:hypothetical protein [Arsenicicoccus dermatophilus]MCH8611637.1 hypothetical protein [Arsenicicoccus dermatophilus]
MAITLDQAVDSARTGDIWIFRGGTGADRAIQLMTNAPVNHVGMTVVLDDLPPLMWHAELGKALVDVWSGQHQRGVQLHDLHDAVTRWHDDYGQRGWMRQLTPEVGRRHEDELLRVIARWDGTSFPRTAALAGRWLRGRRGYLPWRTEPRPVNARPALAYCAEVVAVTYEAMGLLEPGRPLSWYDPGRFWSGDELPMAAGWALGAEIEVVV